MTDKILSVPSGAMKTLADRLRWIFEHRRTNASNLATAAKLKSRSHLRDIIVADEEEGREVSPRGDTLAKVADVSNVPYEWLSKGTGPEPDPDLLLKDLLSDSTPHTPPARSGLRKIERPDVELVQGWFYQTLQELSGERRYPPEEVTPAVAFLTSGNPLTEGGNPRKLVLGALEAVRALRAEGKPTTPAAVQAYLIERNAPPSGPEPGARQAKGARDLTTSTMDREKAKMAKEGRSPKRRRGLAMDRVDVEGVAFCMLRDADIVGISRPRPSQVAVRLEVDVVPDVPPGTEGWFEPVQRLAHVAPGYDEDDVQDRIAHETSHAGLYDFGVAEDEQEEVVDDVTLAWRMPAYVVRRLVRRHGFVPQMLTRFFAKAAPPTEVIRRCASICHVGVILHTNIVGRQVSCESVEGTIEFALSSRDERWLVSEVRRTGEFVLGPFGVKAWPLRQRATKGVVIVLDPERALSLEAG